MQQQTPRGTRKRIAVGGGDAAAATLVPYCWPTLLLSLRRRSLQFGCKDEVSRSPSAAVAGTRAPENLKPQRQERFQQ